VSSAGTGAGQGSYMRIDNAGFVGRSGRLYGDTSNDLLISGNNKIRFGIGGSYTEAMRIDSARQVGIGTASPENRLHVHEDTTGFVAQIENDTGAGNGLKVKAGYYTHASAITAQFGGDNSNTFVPNVTMLANGNVGIGSSSPAAPLDVARASDYKVTKIGGDVTSHYVLTGLADHTLTLTSPSYFQAEIVITANQTNGGTYNNFYMRGIWSNNHTSHHWDEIESIGSLAGSTFTVTVGQNGSTTNSGEWKIVHDYVSGDFDGMTVRITDFYGTHAYTIS